VTVVSEKIKLEEVVTFYKEREPLLPYAPIPEQPTSLIATMRGIKHARSPLCRSRFRVLFFFFSSLNRGLIPFSKRTPTGELPEPVPAPTPLHVVGRVSSDIIAGASCRSRFYPSRRR